MALAFVTVSALCFTNERSNGQGRELVRPSEKSRSWTEQVIKRLSIEEKVGQILQIRFYADTAEFDSAEFRQLREEVKKYHIGSVVLGMHFTRSGPVRDSPENVARVVNQLESESDLPLLVAADLERGVSSRLDGVPSFPWPMAFGATDDSQLVEHFATVTAQEARAVGIHWAYAPVADINSNPSNPVINDRSFGEDPKRVGQLVAAFVKGAHAGGLLVTAKHFPGHGDSSVDSHRQIAIIDKDLDHLTDFELGPFREAIEAGVDSIMPAHARVPYIDPDLNKIATTSRKVVTDLLKQKMKFDGVVVTDALEMKGITTLYDPKEGSASALAAVDALKAGCDAIMIPTDLDGAFHAIVNAVRSGEIPEARLDESVRKILLLKVNVGLDTNRFVNQSLAKELTSKQEDMKFAQEVADNAVTLIRNNGLLPLSNSGLVTTGINVPRPRANSSHGVLVVVLAESLEGSNGVDFEREVRARANDVRIYRVDNRTMSAFGYQVLEDAKSADQVLVAAFVVNVGARQVTVGSKTVTLYGLKGASGSLLQKLLDSVPEKTAVIAFGSPYLVSNFPGIQNYVCTYAMANTSEISAARALFGEIKNHAKLPVTLPGVAPRGFSLPWPPTQVAHPESPLDSN